MTRLIKTYRIVVVALVGPAHLEVHERARRETQRGAHLAALQRFVAETGNFDCLDSVTELKIFQH